MQRKWKDRGVNALSVVLLAIGLAAWIALPWLVLLPIGGLLAVWLVATRSGRLSLAAARIGIATLPQRWGSSSVIVVGIAGVVGVLVAMLAMGQGFQATLNSTGDETTAIVLRGGSQAETNSVITRDLVPLIGSLPGITADANGRPMLSPELSQVVNIASRSDGTDVNAQLRGVGEQAWAVHDKVKIVQGRRFNTGLREMVVGKGALNQFRGLELGKTLTLGSQQWTVVGVFASGDAHDSGCGPTRRRWPPPTTAAPISRSARAPTARQASARSRPPWPPIRGSSWMWEPPAPTTASRAAA